MDRATNAKHINPLLLLLFGAVCISFAPIFVILVGEERLGPTAIGFWRTLFGSVTLFLFTIARGRSLRIPARPFGFAALAGFIFFLDLFVWHRSVVYSGAGMATILGNTQVFATAVLGLLVFREHLSSRFFIAAGSALVGIVLLVGLISEEVIFTTRYLHGIAFGLATGIVYAHYLITLKWARQKEAPPDIILFMAWVAAFSSLFLGVTAYLEPGPVLPPDTESLLLLASLGVVAQAVGWWVISSSLPKIDASRAGLILLLQPTLAMVWGVLFFAEQFTFSQLVGAIITLVAIYLGGLRAR